MTLCRITYPNILSTTTHHLRRAFFAAASSPCVFGRVGIQTWTPNNALDLAIQAVSTFVSETQAYVCTEEDRAELLVEGLEVDDYCAQQHETPKTLAVIDMANYMAFVESWEALSAEFDSLSRAKDDAGLHSQLARARAGGHVSYVAHCYCQYCSSSRVCRSRIWYRYDPSSLRRQ